LSPIETAGLTVFILILFAGTFSVIFSLPGTVFILIDVIIYSWATGFDKIGWKIIVLLIFISIIAETLDFALRALGPGVFGLSKKGAISAIAGGIAGSVILTPLLMGIGTIVGMFLGGFTGMVLVEYFHQRKMKPSFRMGYKTLLISVSGILLKGFSAIVMAIIILANIYD
jgi:uncharacterized protein YqgC (DUF456 family)